MEEVRCTGTQRKGQRWRHTCEWGLTPPDEITHGMRKRPRGWVQGPIDYTSGKRGGISKGEQEGSDNELRGLLWDEAILETKEEKKKKKKFEKRRISNGPKVWRGCENENWELSFGLGQKMTDNPDVSNFYRMVRMRVPWSRQRGNTD